MLMNHIGWEWWFFGAHPTNQISGSSPDVRQIHGRNPTNEGTLNHQDVNIFVGEEFSPSIFLDTHGYYRGISMDRWTLGKQETSLRMTGPTPGSFCSLTWKLVDFFHDFWTGPQHKSYKQKNITVYKAEFVSEGFLVPTQRYIDIYIYVLGSKVAILGMVIPPLIGILIMGI